jgi:hypothetical protein
VTPSTATLYSELPSTFLLSGGNGTYVITSSDQAAIPLSGTFTGTQLTVIPNAVALDTPVILTVRDTGSSSPITASLTVKPRTIGNVVTITPSASQAASCGTSLCAGGDAQVRVVLTQNGLPIAGRTVNFQVVSGDVRFVVDGTSSQETVANSISAVTDASGVALVRIRATAGAPSQTALIQVTDGSSGFTQRASVVIAPTANAPLAVSPTVIAFQGVTAGTCATNVSADVIVTGGRPPYQASQPSGFTVTPSLVSASGGRFTIGATGVCASSVQLAIVDAAGASVTVTLSNTLSSATPTVFAVSPTTVFLNSCNDVANVALVGGTGTYIGNFSGNGAISATVSGNTGRIQRANDSAAPGSSTATVSFTDGKTTQTVTVNLGGNALGACPSTSSPSLAVSPTTVTITDCTSSPTVVLSGGSGTYFASSSNIGLQAIVSGKVLTVRRTRPSDPITFQSICPAPVSGYTAAGLDQCVTVTDGTTSVLLPVLVRTPQASAGCGT